DPAGEHGAVNVNDRRRERLCAEHSGEVVCSREADEDDQGDQSGHSPEEEMLGRSAARLVDDRRLDDDSGHFHDSVFTRIWAYGSSGSWTQRKWRWTQRKYLR